MRLSEADRKALVFGLALHEKGKASLQGGDVQVRGRQQPLSATLQVAWCCARWFEQANNMAPHVLHFVDGVQGLHDQHYLELAQQ